VQDGFDVAITSANGSADSSDYTLVTTTVHFNGTVGESHDISVTITGDARSEERRAGTIGLGAVSNTTATQAAAITHTSTSPATINNDDSATLTLGAAPSITETNADQTKVFTLTLDHAVQDGFDVAITSANGSADSSDYTLVTTTVHFNGTVGESHDISVTITGDA